MAQHTRTAWVIKVTDKESPCYGFYLVDENGGWSSQIHDAVLFDTRKAAVKWGLDFYMISDEKKGDKIVKVSASIKEVK